MLLSDVEFDMSPFRFSGSVIGVLHNDRAALAALGDAVEAAPYKGAPRAPVLYVKPRNTLVASGCSVPVPAGSAFEIGAGIGLVIGRTACAVREADALAHVAGAVIVADLSVPHDSWYRPQIRAKARDASCVIGPRVVPLAAIGEAAARRPQIWIDGQRVQASAPLEWLRPPARLLADVSDFMTLSAGDVLIAGIAHGAPRVAAGHRVAVEIEGLGRLELCTLAAAEAAA